MIRILVILLSLNCAALAAQEKAPTISPGLYKRISQAEKLIGEKSYASAGSSLQKALAAVEKGSYEHAVVLRSLTTLHAVQGHYVMAAQSLKKALDLNVLTAKQRQESLLNLGQMYLATQQYAKAVKVLQPWTASNKADAEISALLANAYAQLKRYRQAVPHIKKAIALRKKPPENWYQLNLALYYELNDYASASKILTRLIRIYPHKKSYWNQLSSAYQQLKNYKKAVSIQHLAYKKGLLNSERELMALINLFAYVGSPYKAGRLLEDSVKNKSIAYNSKNWETLAQIWQQAKEFDKAIGALEKASKLNAKGRLYQQLGQIYIEQEKWQKAIAAFNNALQKGGLKKIGSMHLLMGMSYFELNNFTKAQSAFRKAAQYQAQKKAALQWLDYIRNKG